MPFLREMFFSEANALQLLETVPDVRFPRLIDVGIDSQGLAFIKTELMGGTLRAHRAEERCWLVEEHRPTIAGRQCRQCMTIVYQNVNDYVQNRLLPGLRTLKSNCTGLNGIVLPPRWVTAVDQRERWKPKTNPSANLVFVLHDLVLHNFQLWIHNLEVACCVDVEVSGFFEEEMQRWEYDRFGQGRLYQDEQLVARHIELLS